MFTKYYPLLLFGSGDFFESGWGLTRSEVRSPRRRIDDRPVIILKRQI